MNKTDIPVGQKSTLGMLIDDHRKVLKIAKDYESEKDPAKKQNMVEEACISLIAHTTIEEEIFYPYLREQDPEAFSSMLDEGIVEHGSVKDLISEIRDMDPSDELYDAKFTVIGEFVEHHVKEEEGELFVKVIDKGIDLREMHEALETRKKEVISQEESRA